MKPVISVVVPVYNAKEYLRECLDSIITQRGFEQVELILVDDGSTDVSGAVCSMYSERFPNVIYYRQENAGVSAARNKGIELSRGEYIFFVDSDDFLFGYALKSITDVIKKDSPDMIFFSYKYEYTDAFLQLDFPFEKDEILDKKYINTVLADFMLSDSSFNSVWSKAFRKDIIAANGISFCEGLKYGEDKRFVLDFMEKAETAFYLDKTVYFYRYVESGAIQKPRDDYFSGLVDDYRYSVEKYRCFDVDYETALEKIKKFLAVKVISGVHMAYRKCGREMFKKTIVTAADDKNFSAVLKELVDGDYFSDKESLKVAENLINKRASLIKLKFRTDDIKNNFYKKIFGTPDKETISPDYDNTDALAYPFRVTVFTPVYNRRRTINRVFDSLMTQTYKNFEWLVIDDGSTDNLGELIDEYRKSADFTIRYYYKPNGGKHTAINWSYYLTDSEYMLTVDSDDAIFPETIEKFLSIWDSIPEEKRKDYWSVVARCRNAYTGEMKGAPYPEGINETENPEAEAAKIDDDKFSCPRTEILKQFPFPEPKGTTFVTECIVWNKINRNYKQYYTNEILHNCYQGEEDSLTTSWYKNHIEQGYVSNYFWMCSMLNDSYDGNKLTIALKTGYYGYVSGKSLKEILRDINSPLYKAVCTLEYPFLFVIKKLRYSKYVES